MRILKTGAKLPYLYGNNHGIMGVGRGLAIY